MLQRGMPPVPAEELRVMLEYLVAFYGRNADGSPVEPSEAMRAGDAPAEGGDPGRKLIDAHFCLSCHGTDRKLVGPSFRDIAGKYAADAAARKMLAGKIRSGGSGAWGTVPMPPNTGLSDAELDLVVGYVFKYRP